MKKKIIFFVGLGFILLGLAIMILFGYKRISHELKKQRIIKTSIILDIPSVGIRVPIIEGTSGENLHIAAGHFEGTGKVGSGNYCIAGHNSTIYAEVFNTLSDVTVGDEIYLINNDNVHTKYVYRISKTQIVMPSDTWILQDYGDNRITIVTCTDDGSQRFVVTGILID